MGRRGWPPDSLQEVAGMGFDRLKVIDGWHEIWSYRTKLKDKFLSPV